MAIAENEALKSSTSDPFPRGRTILSLIAVSIGIIFLLDAVTPLGVPVWVLYLIPLILTYQAPVAWIPYLTAGVCAILTLLCLALSGPMTSMPSWMPLLNRAAALGMFAVIAHLIVQYRRATERLIQTAALDAEHKALQLKESLLLKNAQDVQDLYDHAPCGYHSLNSQGMFVGINQTELDWLGYRKDEVIGKIRFLDLLTPESAELFHQQFPRFIERGIVRDLEFEIRPLRNPTVGSSPAAPPSSISRNAERPMSPCVKVIRRSRCSSKSVPPHLSRPTDDWHRSWLRAIVSKPRWPTARDDFGSWWNASPNRSGPASRKESATI